MQRQLVGWCVALVLMCSSAVRAEGPIKVGILGLDAHGLPFTQIVNSPTASGSLATIRVVAAYPGGSPDIPTSVQILGNSIEPCRKLGVEILDTPEQVLEKVDAVMLLSIDGRTHLELAKKVFAAGKPVYVNKPAAASLADVLEIFRLAKEANVPCFSSSALRFATSIQAIAHDEKVGEILGCDAYSPCSLEPHHADLAWYGVHGVEILFTLMGSGCQSVSRTKTEGTDFAVGLWKDGRIGTFRGLRAGPHEYGAKVFGSKSIADSGRFEGYEPLVVEIAKFFQTKTPPVSAEQTIEIFAFIEAADASLRQGGAPVTLESVLEQARQANAQRK